MVGSDAAALTAEARLMAAAAPDLVELRIDRFGAPSDGEAVLGAIRAVREILPRTPLLFTFRTAREGGAVPLDDETYGALNELACASGLVDLVDVELFTPIPVRDRIVRSARAAGVAVVVSNHDFEKTPPAAEMVERLAAASRVGDIPKIAVMPRSPEDVLALLSAAVVARRRTGEAPLIALAMGRLGAVSRLAGEAFGSAVTSGVVSESSAPGQVPIAALRTALDIVHQAIGPAGPEDE
jgi:3-dehydroquinate dehydratase-1